MFIENPTEDLPLVDIAGIGFGPANLALAIAVEEHNRSGSGPAISARFIEKQQQFNWHPGMLLPGTTMQVSFLKDLVTQRNACSTYSFLNYLACRDRLTAFINRQDFFPLRSEFHDYLRWAADRVAVPVDYGCEVTSVRWEDDHFVIEAPGGPVLRARNLALGGGLREKLPPEVRTGPRVFHNHQMLFRFQEVPSHTHRRYVVVGAGQSAAEVTAYLHDYSTASVHSVFAKYGYTPADDSPFANRIFDPEGVEQHFAAGPAWRERMLQYHRSTNYSAVDPVLIQELYRREYSERVTGPRRLYIHGSSEVADVDEREDAVTVTVRHTGTGEVERLECDAVIFATGFESTPPSVMLGDLAADCEHDVHGRPVVDRQYRLQTSPTITGQIFVQGNTEHTHGLSSTLLSNLAVRSGEMVTALLRAERHRKVPAPSG